MRNDSKQRPRITSYDSGYEHSLDHFIEVRRLVAEADDDTLPATQFAQVQKLYLSQKAS